MSLPDAIFELEIRINARSAFALDPTGGAYRPTVTALPRPPSMITGEWTAGKEKKTEGGREGKGGERWERIKERGGELEREANPPCKSLVMVTR